MTKYHIPYKMGNKWLVKTVEARNKRHAQMKWLGTKEHFNTEYYPRLDDIVSHKYKKQLTAEVRAVNRVMKKRFLGTWNVRWM